MPRKPPGEPPLVKICGLTRQEDAHLAERLGADLVGLVLSRGFRRSVPPERAARVVAGTSVGRVAVFVDEPLERAVSLAEALEASVVQLHGTESPEVVARVRDSGNWRVWKAVRASSLGDVLDAVLDYGSLVDAFLIEGSRPGVTGGGGAILDLEAESVADELPRSAQFVLAGGLTPYTVARAVAAYRPDIVDVSSGVEASIGVKDESMMRRFIEAAKSGSTASNPDS